jgi:hypothetical protein
MNDYLLFLSGLKKEDVNPLSNKDFFEARKNGALKIALNAKEKGGPSLLTYWHYSAKDKPYADVLKAIAEKREENYFHDQYDKTMTKLHKTKFDQKEFQITIGELEVWGEAISKLF